MSVPPDLAPAGGLGTHNKLWGHDFLASSPPPLPFIPLVRVAFRPPIGLAPSRAPRDRLAGGLPDVVAVAAGDPVPPLATLFAAEDAFRAVPGHRAASGGRDGVGSDGDAASAGSSSGNTGSPAPLSTGADSSPSRGDVSSDAAGAAASSPASSAVATILRGRFGAGRLAGAAGVRERKR